MNLFGPLSRALALGGVLICAGALPVMAAPADIALLKTYLGTWKGTGTLTGAQTNPVTCRMSLTSGNSDKVNYTGRCAIAGQSISVTGTIAYVDANQRYEAVMNSGVGGFRGVAIGKKSGNGIVFDLQQRANDDAGNDISIASKLTLTPKKIDVVFHATFNDTGDTIDAKIPFSM
jgi:hypothetical protein